MIDVKTFLSDTAVRILPRILTQICRDPGAPFYGACDRNWWHYKIRDFPSVILQQAGYAASLASDVSCGRSSANEFGKLAAATARLWNQRANLHGAFEEYYPYEQGYPPVAFSTLAVAKLCHQGIVPLADIRAGLVVAARQLVSRFEPEAANQQIAGTAALSVIRSLDPSLINEDAFQQLLSQTLELQQPEGWFPEYHGPDLGYLAVSIDCLWDIHDHTHDARIRPAIQNAADCISWFALSPLGAAGMHNSRNTDYFVPYGLVRLALEDSPSATRAAATVRRLFTKTSGDFHPFDAVDDRYWCHYIGHSVFRALHLLENASDSIAPALITTPVPSSKPGSGHALLASPGNACAFVSTRKGAITTARWTNGSTANDFGWVIHTSGKLFVSHWWNTAWKVETSEHKASCEGYLVSHKEHVSEPWKHILLRIASFVFGRRLIRLLKRLVIFKRPLQSHHFSRSVSWDGDILVICDQVTGVAMTDEVERAPRASKRHVASADSYHPEDFEMMVGVKRTETINRKEGIFDCESRYQIARDVPGPRS